VGKKPRAKPELLAAKLRVIRLRLEFSQSQMARSLGYQMTTARISEYESGIREPNLLVLLAYARAGDVTVDDLIDDHKKLRF